MIDEKKLIAEMEKLPLIHGRYDKKNANPYFINGAESMYEMIRELVERQPKVNEWIPCSERLPNSTFNVEVTTKDNKRTIGYYAGYAGNWYSPITDDLIFVKAWKEPSDPWEGE